MDFDIEHLEFLSKIKFSESEKKSFEKEFNRVFEFVSEIENIAIPESLDEERTVTLANLREDEPKSEISREEILANAPKQKDGCFSTPLVVE